MVRGYQPLWRVDKEEPPLRPTSKKKKRGRREVHSQITPCSNVLRHLTVFQHSQEKYELLAVGLKFSILEMVKIELDYLVPVMNGLLARLEE